MQEPKTTFKISQIDPEIIKKKLSLLLNKFYKFLTVPSFLKMHIGFASAIIFFIAGALFYNNYPPPTQIQKTKGLIVVTGDGKSGRYFHINNEEFGCFKGFINNGCSYAGERLDTINTEIDGKVGTLFWYSNPKLSWLNQHSMLWVEISGKQYLKEGRGRDIKQNLNGTLMAVTFVLIFWIPIAIVHLGIFLYKQIFREKIN